MSPFEELEPMSSAEAERALFDTLTRWEALAQRANKLVRRFGPDKISQALSGSEKDRGDFSFLLQNAILNAFLKELSTNETLTHPIDTTPTTDNLTATDHTDANQ